MLVHDSVRSIATREPRQCGGPCRIGVFCVHLAAFAFALIAKSVGQESERGAPDRGRPATRCGSPSVQCLTKLEEGDEASQRKGLIAVAGLSTVVLASL